MNMNYKDAGVSNLNETANIFYGHQKKSRLRELNFHRAYWSWTKHWKTSLNKWVVNNGSPRRTRDKREVNLTGSTKQEYYAETWSWSRPRSIQRRRKRKEENAKEKKKRKRMKKWDAVLVHPEPHYKRYTE